MPVGSTIVVPIVNPGSAGALMRMAALLAAPDHGLVVPVTVVRPDAPREDAEAAHALVREAENELDGSEVNALGVVTVAKTAAEGVLEAMDDRGASLVLMGWRGVSSTRNVFGQLIDSILGRSSVPLAVVRLGESPARRILLPVSTEQLVPAGLRGMHLATEIVRRLQAGVSAPVLVLRTGADTEPLPEDVSALGDRIHHDARRADVAVGAIARADDLIVTPVAPTASGLRAATTHLAWAAPRATLVVAVDVGPPPRGDLASAVRRAHLPAPAKEASGPVTAHTLYVSVVFPAGRPDAELLTGQLQAVGIVEEVTTGSTDEGDGRAVLRATVLVSGVDANAALATAMDHLQSAPALRGAEIRYEVGS